MLIFLLHIPFAPGQVDGGNINLLPGLEFLSEYLFGLENDGRVNPEMYYIPPFPL